MTVQTVSRSVRPVARQRVALAGRSRRTGPVMALGVMVLAATLGLLVGAGAATGQKLIVIALAGLLGGIAVFAVPVTWTLWTMFVMSFLIVGPAVYFLRLGQLQWLPPLFGVALYIQALVLALRAPAARTGARPLPAFLYLLVLFLISATFSSAVAGITAGEFIMSSRYYYFVWGALAVFLVSAVDEQMIDRLWKALLLFTAFQLPMALYQYIFVARKRATGEILSGGAPPWDAVIGTFPGTDTGGGNSAAMAFYLLLMVVLAVALWRAKLLPGIKLAVVVVCALGSMAVAEVKGIVLMIPVVLAIYYRKELLRHPAESVTALLAAAALSVVMLAGYDRLHYSERFVSPMAKNADATLVDRLMNQIDPEHVNDANSRRGRANLMALWWDENIAAGNSYRTLFGHGTGTTQYGNLGTGSLVQRFGPDIGKNTLVVLLWETGLVGTTLFVLMVAAAARLSLRLSGDRRIPELHRVYLRVGAIALMMVLVTLVYKQFAIRLTSIQLLIVLMMGQAFYWYRMLPSGSRDLSRRAIAATARPAP